MSKVTNNRKLQVFLCHSSGDKALVRDLYQRLLADGLDPWLDEPKLLPGQDWELEIRKAVKKSDIIIVCLSESSINRRGFVQKEIKYALDVAAEQPEATIFIIPLKLEECEVPESLRRWHWVRYFEERGYDLLIEALQYRAQSLNISLNPGTGTVKPIETARANQIPQHTSVESRPVDLLTQKPNEAAEHMKTEKSAAFLRQKEEFKKREDLIKFAAIASNKGPIELERMEQIFHERCDSFNRSNKPTTVPDLSYNNKNHRLEAKKYAASLYLHDYKLEDLYHIHNDLYTDKGYEVRILVGLHPDAAQFMAVLPDMDVTRWRLRASADKDGLFWYEVNEHRRFSSEEIVDVVMEALTNLLAAEM